MDVALKDCRGSALDIPASTLDIPASTSTTTTLVATRCEFANSNSGAFVVGSLTSATFNNCVFNDNMYAGVYGYQSTIHLHGDATAIHSNGRYGIAAYHSGKVLIHLPSHHNTFYNNGQDRRTLASGTITNVED